MDTNEIKLQCVRLAIEVMGPHPSTTYVQANKQKFATDVLEEAKAIFKWVDGEGIDEGKEEEETPSVGVPLNRSPISFPPEKDLLSTKKR